MDDIIFSALPPLELKVFDPHDPLEEGWVGLGDILMEYFSLELTLRACGGGCDPYGTIRVPYAARYSQLRRLLNNAMRFSSEYIAECADKEAPDVQT